MRKLIGPITFWKVVFFGIMALGLYATIVRFGWGLGASTNLTDAFPWGIWIGFDVMVGVGLAAGGFTIAAAVHLFHLEEYEPIARPAVLTAFLGYILVAVGLLYDLGQPWFIWHPLIMWNPSSVMFEVAWCVMLYLTVLALEFSPVVLERFKLKRTLAMVRKVYLPLVLMGVLLSIMHQSSLGSLFLIVPDKLYGLWYTPLLPVFFFISAVAAGLSMCVVESYFSHRAFGKALEDRLLQGISKVVVVVLAFYGLWKLQDLAMRGHLGLVFKLNTEAILFWGEMGLGVMLPMVLMATRKVRENRAALFFASLLTVLGFVIGRLNVAVTGMARASGQSYFPSWMELVITLSLVAVGFAVFALAVKYLDLFPKVEMRHARPPTTTPSLGLRAMPTANGYSLAGLWGLLLIGTGLVLFYGESKAVAAELEAPRFELPDDGLSDFSRTFTFPMQEGSPGEVTFDHESHFFYSEGASCATCHTGEQFSILKPGTALSGEVTMERMRQGQLCGACHNDQDAFGVTEMQDCSGCHH